MSLSHRPSLASLRPVVGVSTDQKDLAGHPSLAVGVKYVEPVLTVSQCAPMLLPALGDASLIDDWLDALDGLVFTGSPSNVAPEHYGETLANPATLGDAHRDATTLPLIIRALARGVPILAICRGFQEVNVAMGGSLHQAVQDQRGLMDHREDKQGTIDQQYAPAHEVTAVPGGLLHRLIGRDRWMVNSLHAQGVKRLAEPLVPLAHAPDGLVEAFTHRDAPGFVLAVQWHPEWRTAQDPVSRQLFGAFGDACRAHRSARTARG